MDSLACCFDRGHSDDGEGYRCCLERNSPCPTFATAILILKAAIGMVAALDHSRPTIHLIYKNKYISYIVVVSEKRKKWGKTIFEIKLKFGELFFIGFSFFPLLLLKYQVHQSKNLGIGQPSKTGRCNSHVRERPLQDQSPCGL